MSSQESKRVFGLSRYANLVAVSGTVVLSLTLALISIFVQQWRQGRDSSFMYGTVANVTGSMGFARRSYGLLGIVGNREQSWSTLSSSACDRFKLYNNTAHLDILAPMCGNSGIPDVCSEAFRTHLETRCAVYNDLTIISSATVIVLILGLALGFGALSSIAFTSLITWKRYIIAGLALSGLFLAGGSAAWMLFTTFYFNQLSDTATYPYPSLSWVFYCGLMSGIVALIAAGHLSLVAKSVTPEQERKVGKGGLVDFVEQGIPLEQEEA